MKISVDWKILIIFVFFYLRGKLDIYIIFLLSIILHEMGHLIVGLIFKCKIKNIYIGIFGLSVKFYLYNNKSIYKKIITYLAGPVVNICIALLFVLFTNDNIYFEYILYTNILLAFVNLMPIIPLDGGMISKEILKSLFGIKKANIYILKVSKIFLIILSLVYSILILKLRNIIIFVFILYLWYLYYIECKKINVLIRSYNVIDDYLYK